MVPDSITIYFVSLVFIRFLKIVIVEKHRTLTIFPYSSFFNLYKINFYFIYQIVHGTEGHMAVYGPVRHQKNIIWTEVTWTICYIILFI
jgi:hypothetical protein